MNSARHKKQTFRAGARFVSHRPKDGRQGQSEASNTPRNTLEVTETGFRDEARLSTWCRVSGELRQGVA
jgi:hypothetical protein